MITHGLRIVAHDEGVESRYNGDEARKLRPGRSWIVYEVQPTKNPNGTQHYPRVLESTQGEDDNAAPIKDPNPKLVRLGYGASCFTGTIDMGWAIAIVLTDRKEQFRKKSYPCREVPRKQWNFQESRRPRVQSVEIGMVMDTPQWDANLFVVSRQLTKMRPEQTLAAPNEWVNAQVWHPRSVALRMLREMMIQDRTFADCEV